jgi:hypothetical protein
MEIAWAIPTCRARDPVLIHCDCVKAKKQLSTIPQHRPTMVIVNDMKVQLVSADNENTKFQEHKKDWKTCVEAEPNAEYFIAIRRMKRAFPRTLLCTLKVDGKALAYYSVTPKVEKRPGFCGIASRRDGETSHRALRFVEVVRSANDGGAKSVSAMAGMGKVEVEVYEAMECKSDYQWTGDFNETPLHESESKSKWTGPASPAEKNLRSREGRQRMKNNVEVGQCYSKGNHLYTITLHYCAVPGLIAVGILLKLSVEDAHAEQSKVKQREESEKRNDRSVKGDSRGSEMIELLDDDSGTECSDVIELLDDINAEGDPTIKTASTENPIDAVSEEKIHSPPKLQIGQETTDHRGVMELSVHRRRAIDYDGCYFG